MGYISSGWPNGRKLSDGEGESKLGTQAVRRSLERLVRRVALGVLGNEGRTSHRRGKDGCCRREGPTEAEDEPRRQTSQRNEREPACPPPPSQEEKCLTDSSSATEAGEDGLWMQNRRTASLCSLERVVRPGGYTLMSISSPRGLVRVRRIHANPGANSARADHPARRHSPDTANQNTR